MPQELQWVMLWSYTVTSKQEGNGSWGVADWAAVVRVAGQKRTAKHLRCPVQKLYPVEMSVSTVMTQPETSPLLKDDAEPNPEPTPPVQVRRSKRVAARTAADRLLAQAIASDSSDDEC